MKLKQIKEFNSITVTQEIAAEIAAIVCWNHLNEERYKEQFIIEDSEPCGIAKNGSGSCFPWQEKRSDLYIKTPTGVRIGTPNSMSLRIFKNGTTIGKYNSDDTYSDYECITRNKHTGEETPGNRDVYQNYQIKLIQFYLDSKFFTIK